LTDLEKYLKTGHLRANKVKKNNLYSQQKSLIEKKHLKIGFLGSFGAEPNFPKEFFVYHSEHADVYLYDLIRPSKNNYNGTNIFDGYSGVVYQKTPPLAHWMVSTENYDTLLNMFEKDEIDILINVTGDYILPLFDRCTIPVLLHLATSSLPMPHPKFLVQGFIQPPWPYKIVDGTIINLKEKTYLDGFYAIAEGLMFNARGAKAFKREDFLKKKKQIFFAGNLKKLAAKEILTMLVQVLKSDPDITLVYYGKGARYQSSIEKFFTQRHLTKQVLYKGKYISHFDQNGRLIDDGNVYRAYNDLFESKLFLNTFPLGGARSCLEAYYAGVAVVHLNIDEENWLDAQTLQPFKLPTIFGQHGSASTVEEYKNKCATILKEDTLYNKIIKEQDTILQKATAPERMWQTIFFMIKKDQELKSSNEKV
jgi:hypothetical protein